MAMRFEEVLIDRIRANAGNIREDMGDMEQLAADVKAMGVQTPIIVYPHPGIEGDYLVQEGHRRRLAAITAGLSTIPCNIKDAPKRGKREDLEVMLTTGRNHKTLTEAEVNHGIQGLLDLEMDVTTIGKKFKMSRSEINARAKLTTAPAELQKRFDTGSLDLLGVQKIQELEEQGSEGILDTVLSELNGPSVRHDESTVTRILERAKTIHASKVEVERLLALGGRKAPSDAYSSGLFKRVTAEKHEEEHIAAGHHFQRGPYADTTTWYEKQTAAKAAQTTDAEKAEKQKASRLNGLLGIAFRTRRSLLASACRTKDGGMGEAADFEMLFDLLWSDISRLDVPFLEELTGISKPEDAVQWQDSGQYDAWMTRVEKRIRTFSWRQLARLATLYQYKDTDKQLRFAKSFDRTGTENAYAWRSRSSWLEKVQRIFGYELDSSEIEAIESAKDKAGPDRDKDCDVDTVTETCSGCRQSVVGGEGWDGLCGDCSDRAEAAADGAED